MIVHVHVHARSLTSFPIGETNSDLGLDPLLSHLQDHTYYLREPLAPVRITCTCKMMHMLYVHKYSRSKHSKKERKKLRQHDTRPTCTCTKIALWWDLNPRLTHSRHDTPYQLSYHRSHKAKTFTVCPFYFEKRRSVLHSLFLCSAKSKAEFLLYLEDVRETNLNAHIQLHRRAQSESLRS